MERLFVEHFGPIESVDISFGDLTFLVGAQASGKSLFLELLKLLVDRDAIISNLRKYSFIIDEKNPSNLLEAFFGYGMSNVWKSNTKIVYDGVDFSSKSSLFKKNNIEEEKLFYTPAQRIFSISDGRPKAFSEFDPSTPYVLRQFSEILRVFMYTGLGGNSSLFPITTRLKAFQRKSFDDSIFHGGMVEMQNENGQRKMRLKVDGMNMPFMTWSAGQKEFMPLLMGFYCVSGQQYLYAVIEEPEMGLHPKAMMSVLLQILELVRSGIKIIVSTHSTVPLEFVWAFNMLGKSKNEKREKALAELFGDYTSIISSLAGIFDKEIRTFSFARNKAGRISSVDISTLDAFDENREISEWGGLSEYATSASQIVSKYSNL